MGFKCDLNKLFFNDVSISLDGLSSSEKSILKHLAEAHPEALSREELLTIGWPDKVVTDTSLNVAINSIRKHIFNQLSGNYDVLFTERGFGYRLNLLQQKKDNQSKPEHTEKTHKDESDNIKYTYVEDNEVRLHQKILDEEPIVTNHIHLHYFFSKLKYITLLVVNLILMFVIVRILAAYVEVIML